jgi:hypothetical protein
MHAVAWTKLVENLTMDAPRLRFEPIPFGIPAFTTSRTATSSSGFRAFRRPFAACLLVPRPNRSSQMVRDEPYIFRRH